MIVLQLSNGFYCSYLIEYVVAKLSVKSIQSSIKKEFMHNILK